MFTDIFCAILDQICAFKYRSNYITFLTCFMSTSLWFFWSTWYNKNCTMKPHLSAREGYSFIHLSVRPDPFLSALWKSTIPKPSLPIFYHKKTSLCANSTFILFCKDEKKVWNGQFSFFKENFDLKPFKIKDFFRRHFYF